ncbi:MmgE/PrpD family protein [Nocardia vaccinii]|uniref:MmgE/PrpD family protein n=1 Tax=Nocardia vaccinii TaxID=1822 RepID=UPI000830C407|nr:MmgE/PrpD family protein [Nocardia vaccinii]
MTEQPSAPLAARVAEFAARTTRKDIPDEVLERARHLILDSVGLAFAATTYPFSAIARDALSTFGTGECPVLGSKELLSPRDAAMLNGVLVHGLDFDDTHIPAVTHVSAAALPAALSAAIAADADGMDLLTAYILGVEVSARVGIAAHGAFHDIGFHPTGVVGAFGSAVAAGKLMGLDAAGLATAQGIVGSMASGLLEFLQDGAWTKRLHPGWAAMSGLTAATFAKAGWTGPGAIYEGRFGLFNTHLADRDRDPGAVAADLGETWELMRTAVKPYPVCHFIHAFADSAQILLRDNNFGADDIVSVRCAIHATPRRVVCEPEPNKWAPSSEYDAKFSLPYVVATVLARGRFTLAELDDAALADPAVLALARKVEIVDDPESAFPAAYSGAVEIRLTDGRTIAHREQVNRGHDERPLGNAEIVEKFSASMALATDAATADRVRGAVLGLGSGASAREFAEACRG